MRRRVVASFGLARKQAWAGSPRRSRCCRRGLAAPVRLGDRNRHRLGREARVHGEPEHVDRRHCFRDPAEGGRRGHRRQHRDRRQLDGLAPGERSVVRWARSLSGCSQTETNGVISFSGCKVDKVGTGYTLTATDGSLTAAVSGSFNIIPGPAAQVIFSQGPTDIQAGADFSPDVALRVADAAATRSRPAATRWASALRRGRDP